MEEQELSHDQSSSRVLISRGDDSEEIVQFSQNELQILINKLDHVLTVIKGRRSNEHSRPIRHNTCFMKLWDWIVKYFFVKTVLWQIACIGLLSIIEKIQEAKEAELSHSIYLGTAILILFEVVLVFVAVCMSIKIIRQYLHMTLSAWFLAQAYLASILVFTGLYTLFVRLSPTSFKHVENFHQSDFTFKVYCQMLFFSISTATLCGVSLTFPNVWYAYITVSFQMLLSFVYFASILSLIVNRPRRNPVKDNSQRTAGLITDYGTETTQGGNG